MNVKSFIRTPNKNLLHNEISIKSKKSVEESQVFHTLQILGCDKYTVFICEGSDDDDGKEYTYFS